MGGRPASPPQDSADWFISGFADGADELGGTAAVVDEPRGDGRATVFSVEPNFRAFTTGFQKLLRNTLLSDDAGTARPAPIATAARARRAATRVLAGSNTIRLAVRPSSVAGPRRCCAGSAPATGSSAAAAGWRS